MAQPERKGHHPARLVRPQRDLHHIRVCPKQEGNIPRLGGFAECANVDLGRWG
jgi:hypothetical protein